MIAEVLIRLIYITSRFFAVRKTICTAKSAKKRGVLLRNLRWYAFVFFAFLCVLCGEQNRWHRYDRRGLNTTYLYNFAFLCGEKNHLHRQEREEARSIIEEFEVVRVRFLCVSLRPLR
jgi:hypothetical protein